jgi:signal transduction histidine kinase
MLRNMRVGTKLVAILIAPLVVLGVLAGLGVSERLGRVSDANLAERLAIVAGQTAETIHAVQLEQLWAGVVVGSAGAVGHDTYEKLIAQTDEQVAVLREVLGGIGDVEGDLADRVDAAQKGLDDMNGLRQAVLAGDAGADPTLDGYHQVFLALNAIYGGAAAQPIESDLAADLQSLATLSRGKDSTADADTRLAGVLADWPTLDPATRSEGLQAARDDLADAQRRYDTFFEQASPPHKALLHDAQTSSDAQAADALTRQVLAAGTAPADAPPPVGVTTYVDTATGRLEGELGVEREISASVLSEARSDRADAKAAARIYLLGAAAAILAALALAFLVARSITRPLRQLTRAANQLAGEQLPQLVERLRSPESAEPVELVPIPVRSRDEIGQLAGAFNDIQSVTAEVADEQAVLLRKGIGDIFVNLARRNQTLLDRQIEFIDQLEANEADPDQLENLFRLDHLATRMRRNAESLLVLAGADPPRRRGRPVALADVVRVAIGEVEDFARVNLLALHDVSIAANVAVDLSHLLAELMDNATQFSPPETLVEVVGNVTRDDAYLLQLTDQGIGMSADQLAEANEQLAHPPLMGLTIGRSLGFTVIGRLATRHGIGVRLTGSPSGGIMALVTLPAALVGELTTRAPGAAPSDALPSGRPPAEAEVPAAPTPTTTGPALAPATDPGAGSTSPARPQGEPLVVAGAAPAAHLTPAAGPNGFGNGRASAHGVESRPIAAAPLPGVAPDLPRRAPGGAPPGDLGSQGAPVPPGGRVASSDGGEAFTYYDVDEDTPATPPVSAVPPAPAPEPVAMPSVPPEPVAMPAPAVRSIFDAPPPSLAGDRAAPDPTPPPRPDPVPDPVPAPAEAGATPNGPPEPARQGDGRAPQLTAAGLVRRSPKQQIRDLTAEALAPGAPRPATQRSPEEVRRMLSRYRTGLQRGRTETPGDGDGRPEAHAAGPDAGSGGRADEVAHEGPGPDAEENR